MGVQQCDILDEKNVHVFIKTKLSRFALLIDIIFAHMAFRQYANFALFHKSLIFYSFISVKLGRKFNNYSDLRMLEAFIN
jgi:hypothetical protein